MIITQINLLPWREELRQEQKKQFALMSVMTWTVLPAPAAAFLVTMTSRISTA